MPPLPRRFACLEYTVNQPDLEKRRAAGRASYARHREARVASAAAWNRNNPERRKAIVARNHAKYPERKNAAARKTTRVAAGILGATDENRHGTCPICLKTKQLCCDHDHVTGHIRGWICRTCNVFLGPTNEGRGARAAAYEAGELK